MSDVPSNSGADRQAASPSYRSSREASPNRLAAAALDNRSLLKGFFVSTPSKIDAAVSDQNVHANSLAPSPATRQMSPNASATLTPPPPPQPAKRPLEVRTPRPAAAARPTTPVTPIAAAHAQQQQQQQQQQSAQGTYSIAFPPGPMGLELEPVIISSERQLGCRVKDFYFGIDHTGVDPMTLQEQVMMGDVISHVDGACVLSLRFTEILEMLRGLKAAHRVVAFKNISASWTSAPPVVTTTPKAQKVLKAPHLSNAPSDLESYTVVQPSTPGSTPAQRDRPSYHTPLKESESSSGSSSSSSKSALTLSPKAVRDLARATRLSPKLKAFKSAAPFLADAQSAIASSVDLQRVLGQVGSTFLPLYSTTHVQSIVSKKHMLLHELSQSCVQLGMAETREAALTNQVDSLRAESLEMKKALVHAREELASKREELVGARTGLNDALAAIESLQSELSIVSQGQGAANLSVTCADAETKLAQEEVNRERQLKELALRNADEYKTYISELTAQMNEQARLLKATEEGLHAAREAAEDEAAARRREQASFAEDLARITSEQQATRSDVQLEFASAVSRLEALERERDTAVAELEVLRDLGASDRAKFESECARLRESLVSQSDLHKAYALQKEDELDNLRSELREATVAADVLLKRKEEALRSLGDEQESITDLQQRLKELSTELRLSEEKLSSADFEFDCVCEERALLQQRVDTADTQILSLTNTLCQTQEALQSAQQEASKLSSKAAQRSEEAFELRSDVDDYSLQVRVCKDALVHKDALLQAAESQSLAHQQALNMAQHELAVSSTQLQHLQAQQILLQEDAVRLTLSLAEAQRNANASESTALDLQKRLGASEIEAQCQQAEVAVLRDEMNKLTTSIDRSRAKAEADKLEQIAAEASAQDKVEALEKHMERLKQDLLVLEEKALSVESSNACLNDELGIWKDKLSESESQVVSLTASAMKAEEAMVATQVRLQEVQTSLDKEQACWSKENAALVVNVALAETEQQRLRQAITSIGSRLGQECRSLRVDLAACRTLVQDLSQHNDNLTQAFAQSEREKHAVSDEIATLMENLRVAEERSEADATSAHELEAALAEAREQLQMTTAALHTSMQQQHFHEEALALHQQRHIDAEREHAGQLSHLNYELDQAQAKEEAASARSAELVAKCETQQTELLALRTYCEDQRVNSLALQEVTAEAEAREQRYIQECASLHEQISTSYANFSAAVAAAAADKAALSSELTALKLDNEARIAEQSDRHVRVLETFRAERARILSSYEHMLEESKRCALKAATQQHEQYEAKLHLMQNALRDQHASEMRAAEERERASSIAAQAAVSASQAAAQAHTRAIEESAELETKLQQARQDSDALQGERQERQREASQHQKEQASLLQRLASLQDQLDEANESLKSAKRSQSSLQVQHGGLESAKRDAEREASLLRGLVSSSIEQTKATAGKYLQQAKSELQQAVERAVKAEQERDHAVASEKEVVSRAQLSAVNVVSLESQLGEAKQREIQLEQSLQTSTEQAKKLRGELEKQHASLREKDASITTLETNIKTMRAVEAAPAVDKQIQKALADALHEAKTAQQRHAESDRRLRDARRDVADLQQAVAALRAQCQQQTENSDLSGSQMLQTPRTPPHAQEPNSPSSETKYRQQLQQTQSALQTISSENAHMRQRAAEMMQALRMHQDALEKAESREAEHLDRRARLEAIVIDAQQRVHDSTNQLQQSERDREALTNHSRGAHERISMLESTIQDLSVRLAESRGEALHTRQALLNARAELDALHRQVNELLSSSLTPAKHLVSAFSDENDEDQENVDPLNPTRRSASVARTQSATTQSHTQPSRMRAKAAQSQQERLPLQPSAAHAQGDPIQLMSRARDSEVDDENAQDCSMDSDMGWHDRLVALCLDMHEALVFALVEKAAVERGGDAVRAGISFQQTSAGGSEGALLEASLALQQLHEHCLSAPWLRNVSTVSANTHGTAMPTLPPAHEMVRQLDAATLSNMCAARQASVAHNSQGQGQGQKGLELARFMGEASARSSMDSEGGGFLRASVVSSMGGSVSSAQLPSGALSWVQLAATAEQRAKQEAELWAERARVETLSLQLALSGSPSKSSADDACTTAAVTAQVSASSPNPSSTSNETTTCVPHRAVLLLNEMLELLESPSSTSADNQAHYLPALPASERALYQGFLRMLREVVTQYRLQVNVLTQQLRLRSRNQSSAEQLSPLRAARFTGHVGAASGAGEAGAGAGPVSSLVDNDSFDSVNTGERDESDFWDVSACSIDDSLMR